MTSRAIKVAHAGTIRKLAVSSESTWEEFEKHIRDVFGLQKGNVSLVYTDEDGDLIAINTTRELREVAEWESVKKLDVLVTVPDAKDTGKIYPAVPPVFAEAPKAAAASSSKAPAQEPLRPAPVSDGERPVAANASAVVQARGDAVDGVVQGGPAGGPQEDFFDGVERLGSEIQNFVESQVTSAVNTANGAVQTATPIPQTVSVTYGSGTVHQFNVPQWINHPLIFLPLAAATLHTVGKTITALPAVFLAAFLFRKRRGMMALAPLAVFLFGFKVLWWMAIPMLLGGVFRKIKGAKQAWRERRRGGAGWAPPAGPGWQRRHWGPGPWDNGAGWQYAPPAGYDRGGWW